jgi:hypothetical protein
MKRIFYILLFILSCLFYWGTSQYIENRTEAEDAFEYATMVETDGHSWLYHPHHLIYGPAMKVSYSLIKAMGFKGQSHDFLMLVSSLSASGSLFFFFLFCYRRFSLRPVSSLMATGLLAVSYGFWRYAAEAEIVLPASLLVLIALYYATDSEQKRRNFLLATVFSTLAILMHIMNAVAVFIAIPCFYLLRHRWKAALLHVVLCAGIIISVFGIVMQSQTLYSGGGAQFIGIGLSSLVKAMVALGQCVVSGDFVLGFRSVRAFLSELFASRMLAEEFFLGAQLSRPLILFSFLTYLLFSLFFSGCMARAAWVWKNMVQQRNRFQLPSGMATLAIAMIWFFSYAGLLLCIEPGNPELWVMGLIPLWLLFCGLVLLPLTVDNRLWLPFAMFLLLFIHNGVGGISVLGDSAKDYQQEKAKWILEHASANDLVVTAGNPVFERYLRYHFKGEVLYLHNWSQGQLKGGELPFVEGDIYVMGDVFNQVQSLRIRFPEKTRQIDLYAETIRPESKLIDEDIFGGIYQLRKNAERIIE